LAAQNKKSKYNLLSDESKLLKKSQGINEDLDLVMMQSPRSDRKTGRALESIGQESTRSKKSASVR